MRPSHLPPRCPPQSRAAPPARAADAQRRLASQASLPEERPPWLDDLLSDLDTCPRGTSLRRSTSDPVTILEASAAYHQGEESAGEGNAVSPVSTGGSGSGFEGVYGPNSPRQKSGPTDSMVTALLEGVPRKPLMYMSPEFLSGYDVAESGAERDGHLGAGDADLDKSRRRSGQRSRVRKLQYIAELEKTVENFQTFGAELAARVASQFQERVVLSMENKRLKQQMVILRQEKMIKDGEYNSLKNEVEKLKLFGGCHRKSKSAASCLEMGNIEKEHSGSNWQILDMGKLSLGGSTVPLNHGIRR